MNLIDTIIKFYNKNPYEPVERVVINAKDEEESVTMQRAHWDYLDWLDQDQCINIPTFIRRCSAANPSADLGRALECWVFWEFEIREKEGLPRPDWIMPYDEV